MEIVTEEPRHFDNYIIRKTRTKVKSPAPKPTELFFQIRTNVRKHATFSKFGSQIDDILCCQPKTRLFRGFCCTFKRVPLRHYQTFCAFFLLSIMTIIYQNNFFVKYILSISITAYLHNNQSTLPLLYIPLPPLVQVLQALCNELL